MTFFLSLSFYVFKSLNASFSVSLRDPFKAFLSESLYLIMSPCSFLTLHLSFSLYVFSNDDVLFTCPCHVSLLVYLFFFFYFSISLFLPNVLFTERTICDRPINKLSRNASAKTKRSTYSHFNTFKVVS